MGIRPGDAWGEPIGEPAGVPTVTGDDRDLARVVAQLSAAAPVRFVPAPSSDLARAVGLGESPVRGVALPMDVLVLDDRELACNAVVYGIPPDRLQPWTRLRPVTVTIDGRVVFEGRATGVVVATGEFLRGRDLSPRGHPGDGRAEVQIYAVTAGERRAVRSRLRTGSHLPHARIVQRTGRSVTVAGRHPARLEADGHRLPARSAITVEVRPNAYRLVV